MVEEGVGERGTADEDCVREREESSVINVDIMLVRGVIELYMLIYEYGSKQKGKEKVCMEIGEGYSSQILQTVLKISKCSRINPLIKYCPPRIN